MMSKYPVPPMVEQEDSPPPYDAVAGPLSATRSTQQGQYGTSDDQFHDSRAMQQLDLNDEKRTTYPVLAPVYSASSASSASLSRRTNSEQSFSRPCIVPQLKGALDTYATPFVRAYAPGLANHGISKKDFTLFVDGLNEAFLGNPVLQGTSMVGMVLSNFHGVPPVQLAGGIVQVVSGVGSAAVSISRTRLYVQAMNEKLFNPAGLHVNLLSTEKMLRHVRFPGAEFPTTGSGFENSSSVSVDAPESQRVATERRGPDAATLRRMRKLEGYCQPLDYDVPPSVQPENLLKRMGNAQAARMASKHEQKMKKRYEKAEAKDRERGGENDLERQESGLKSDKKQSKTSREVEKIGEKMAAEEAALERDLASSNALRDPKEADKVRKKYEKEVRHLQKALDKELRDHDKEMAKLEEDRAKDERKAGKRKGKGKGQSEREKLEEKEDKGVKKLRWIVVSRVEDGEDESEDSLSEKEEVVEDGMRVS